MKLIYCLMIFFCPFVSRGQTVKTLTIGDTVPDLTLTNVYNYPSATIRLSDLKGKLVILDFWSTWCSGCMDVMPKMQKLQKKFQDKLQVILVNTYNGDSIKKVESLFARRKLATGETVELPFTLLQESLFDYFPYKFLPHYAWIDENGKVMALTTQTEVTEENIEKIINGQEVALHTTSDMMDFDREKPLFINNNGGDGETLLYRSILLPFYAGIGNSVGHDEAVGGKLKRFFAFNQLPSALLALGFRKEMELPLNRRYYEGDSDREWKALLEDENPYHGYTYEIMVPPVDPGKMAQYIREDMVRYFGIVPHIETRKIKCLVLKRGSKGVSRTKYKSPQIRYTGGTDSPKYIRSEPVSFIVKILNYFLPVPLVDESGITQPIDLALPNDLHDEKALILALKNAGFDITSSEKEMEVTVITSGNH